jgi:hypothetical protein
MATRKVVVLNPTSKGKEEEVQIAKRSFNILTMHLMPDRL